MQPGILAGIICLKTTTLQANDRAGNGNGWINEYTLTCTLFPKNLEDYKNWEPQQTTINKDISFE